MLGFVCLMARAQSAPPRTQATPPCSVTEDSIFHGARICGKSREGSLGKADLTVAGFVIGESTLEDITRRFPGSHQFKLTEEMEASTGICLKSNGDDAVVFSSGDLTAPRILDSVFMAKAGTFEKQGAKCLEVTILPDGPSTKSGIRLGMRKERVLARLQVTRLQGTGFEVDYSTSPGNAPWLPLKFKASDTKGSVAMSGVYGGFRNGRLRWVVLYAGVSN